MPGIQNRPLLDNLLGKHKNGKVDLLVFLLEFGAAARALQMIYLYFFEDFSSTVEANARGAFLAVVIGALDCFAAD